MTIYVCSDGSYYTSTQLWEQFESGEWSPCCWDSETGQEWVRTAEDDLLLLTPVSETHRLDESHR